MMPLHRYDVRPSKPLDLPQFKQPLRARLPSVVDLTGLCSPIQDQGKAGSCTAHAMSGMLEFLELQDFREKVRMQPEEFAGKGLHHPSRLFIYYNERLIENTPTEDSGASISDSVSSVVKYGFCDEVLWPYDLNNLLSAPNPAAYSQAMRHRCSSYRQLTIDDLIPCLAGGNPFIMGISVYSSFESPRVAATGIVPMPGFAEEFLGGHAICCVGYDDPNQQFICRNSWGTNWGQNGFFRLPFEYVTNELLASDFWTVIK